MDIRKHIAVRLSKRGFWCAVLTIACQIATYAASQLAVRLLGLPTHTAALAWDAFIPFLPGFLVPYLGCFLHWVATFYLLAADEDGFSRFFAGAVLGYVISMAVFLLWPVTIARPDPAEAGWWEWLYRIVCGVDSPLNLFPSIHCFAAWMCYLGVRRSPAVGVWYRWFTLVMAITVFASTVFVKQHYIIDVAGGVALAQLCWLAAGFGPVRARAARIIMRLPK